MPELIRRLNADGIARFKSYIEARKRGEEAPAIDNVLRDSATSSSVDVSVNIEMRGFADRFQFGQYLVELLAPLDRRQISRDHGLWTWLTLYYFDQLCPADVEPTKISALEAYILPSKYNHFDYYRHLVRTPWLAVSEHGDFAKVLLVPRSTGKSAAPLAVRGEILEQLASRQAVFRNRRVIEAAYRLYWDAEEQKPRRGTGGSADVNGPPRRLGLVLRQFDLTYDLDIVSAQSLIELLPKEFAKWRK